MLFCDGIFYVRHAELLRNVHTYSVIEAQESNLRIRIRLTGVLVIIFDHHLCGRSINNHKKVLLRERKRHTDRGVSSTPSVTRGGVPPSPDRGIPLAGWGTPSPSGPGWGTPLPIWTWPGYPPTPLCRQTDRHVSKHNLPYYLRGR